MLASSRHPSMIRWWLVVAVLTSGCGGLARPNFAPPPSAMVQFGPRPEYLVRDMDEGALKAELESCLDHPASASDFSIGHRGAPLFFPEHTRESYLAAARMGAGIIECDVTFTRDLELVCRHSQCDLHTTTDILSRPELAARCSQPFQPYDPRTGTPASARCCTSDITLAEFSTLCGKMDAFDSQAKTPQEYLGGTAPWRTDLYSTCGTVMTHQQSIDLIHGDLGLKMTPELKTPSVEMPFGAFSQHDFAQKLIDEYKGRAVAPERVYPQSFLLDDVLYWLREEPLFGERAVWLDGRDSRSGSGREANFKVTDPTTWDPAMDELRELGLRTLAPPIWMLLQLDENGRLAPSIYAKVAREAGLDLITWTLERSGPLAEGGDWYYQTVSEAINNDGDVMEVLRVLDQEVGVQGVFSDWPATVTFYANCVGRDKTAP